MKRRVLITEALVFSTILLGTVFSAYRVFSPNIVYTEQISTKDRPSAFGLSTNSKSELRTPSSIEKEVIQNSYEPLNISCTDKNTFETKNSRIRLVGTLCKFETKNKFPIKAHAKNLSMKYDATVFNSTKTNDFSTDFVPLGYGANSIVIDFADAEDFHQKVNVVITRLK